MEKAERNYGLDILRTLSMCGIIGLHVIGAGGLLNNVEINMTNYYIVYFLEILFYCSVNIFAMLTGYLYYDKKNIKSKSVIELIFVTMFYCVAVTAVFYIFNFFNVRSAGIKPLIKSIFPPVAGRYWYITCYILLFLMIPYLNMFLRKLKKENYKILLLTLFILLSIICTFGITDYFHIDSGYSPFWLIYCYMIGVYIKKYHQNNSIKKKKILLIIILNVLIVLMSNVVIYVVTDKIFGQGSHMNLLMKYNSPFIVVNGICIFLMFEKMIVKRELTKKISKQISATAFGVYLLHSSPLIYDYILTNRFGIYVNSSSFKLFTIIIAAIAIIYVVGSIAENIRTYIFKTCHINKLAEQIGFKLDSLTKISECDSSEN